MAHGSAGNGSSAGLLQGYLFTRGNTNSTATGTTNLRQKRDYT